MRYRINIALWGIKPHVHNLPKLICVKWLGYEWFIRKDMKYDR